ncbi:MAG: hypothetical protein K5662_06425 [Lachnospiraceae bacterium]|nr:hypothetical protein [Lachnospiraceae bacterium]
MPIGNVELNSAMTGIQDYTSMRHNEQSRPMLQQSVLQDQNKQEVNDKLTNVHEADNADRNNKKFDARDKGSNEYHGNGGRDRKKKEKEKDGKVVPKKLTSFDMKI